MKTAPHHLQLTHLAAFLQQIYALPPVNLTFVPKGEDSYSYLVEAADGARYFTKLHDPARIPEIAASLALLDKVVTECVLSFVLGPLPTVQGESTAVYEQYIVALFAYIDGVTAYEQPLTTAESHRLATQLAALHACPHRCLPALAQERFYIPHSHWLLPTLEQLHILLPERYSTTVGIPPLPGDGRYQSATYALLQQERADILATFARLQDYQDTMVATRANWVVTHGDLTSGNILRSDNGPLYLIDWGELALGPAERDLVHFTGDNFADFLATYLAQCPEPVSLHSDSFAFYIYRWILQEIGDYGWRIFSGQSDPAEVGHAWAELNQYLPIHHDEVKAGVRQISNTLSRK